MARTAVRGRLTWHVTRVRSVIRKRTRDARSTWRCPTGRGYRAGQHLDVRLTAEGSYAITTAGGKPVAITVERLDDGEVSPYRAGELRAGDEVKFPGPIGRWFVWDTSDSGPLLLVAGGSGAAGPVAETVVYLRGPTSAA